MEYVSPSYEQVLTNLAENLMADHRERFTALLQQTDGLPFIPKPRTELSVPQEMAEIV